MKPIVLGVDPGGRTVGLVLREGDRLLAHDLLTRGVEPVEAFAQTAAEATLAFLHQHAPSGAVVARVEQVVAPKGFKHGQRAALNPAHLIGVSVVAGAIALALSGEGVPVGWVRPAGHGSAPDWLGGTMLWRHMAGRYPAELMPKRKKGAAPKFTDRLRHARSAWDIAAAPPVERT